MLVVIASSNADIVEERVCLFSLINTGHKIEDIRIIDGETGEIYDANRTTVLGRFEVNSLSSSTNFTQVRSYIPLKFQGVSTVVIDPDTIVFEHLSGIFSGSPAHGIYARQAYGYRKYATSVMGYNLPKMSKSDSDLYVELLASSEFSIEDKIYLSEHFARALPWDIHRIASKWNSFDYVGAKTSVLHFTNLRTQPWIYGGHPLMALWFGFASSAIESGYLTNEHIAVQSRTPLPYDNQRMSLRPDFTACLDRNYGDFGIFKKMVAAVTQSYRDVKFQNPIPWLWNWLL